MRPASLRLAAVATGHQVRTAKRAWSKGPKTPEIVETIELEGVKGDLTRTLEGVDVVIPASKSGPGLGEAPASTAAMH